MKLAGLLEIFSSNILNIPITAHHQRPNEPITICTAQLQARSALCFILLIKSPNFAELLEYFAVIYLIF
jgi:hypothetical protein